MRTISLLSLILFCSSSLPVFAGSDTATLARILVGIKHFPSDADRADLQDIIDSNAGNHEKTIAHAILNLKHVIGDTDKAKLQAIVDDPGADAQIKTLANALIGIQHMMKEGSEDYEQISQIASTQ